MVRHQPPRKVGRLYEEYVTPISKGYDPFAVLLDIDDFQRSVVRFQQPRIITREEQKRAVGALDSALRTVE